MHKGRWLILKIPNDCITLGGQHDIFINLSTILIIFGLLSVFQKRTHFLRGDCNQLFLLCSSSLLGHLIEIKFNCISDFLGNPLI
jgi:hypothetical protein